MKRKLLTGAALLGSFFAMNAQDDCSSAIELSEGVTAIPAIAGEYIPAVCWSVPTTAAQGPDADMANWYYVVAPANGVYRVNTNLPQNTGTGISSDTRASVFSGTCDALTCWSAGDDVYYGPTEAESNFLTDFEFPVVAGDTYYISFDNRWDDNGFDVDLTFIPADCETTVPFSESWDPTTNYWFCWSKVDNNQDSNGFQLLTDYDFGGDNMAFDNAVGIFSYQDALDDFLVSGDKELEEGVEYTLSVTYNALDVRVSSTSTVAANESFEPIVVSGSTYSTLGEETGITMAGTGQGNLINNAITSTYTFTPSASGTYSVGVHATTESGGALLFFNISLSETASTSQANSSEFSVYPNPTNGVVNIANAKAQINEVKIVDINGRTVKASSFAGVSNAQVNISDLANGVYMMTINSDKGSVTKKVVKN